MLARFGRWKGIAARTSTIIATQQRLISSDTLRIRNSLRATCIGETITKRSDCSADLLRFELVGDKSRQGAPIKWYSCGPTVYDDMHMGHARTYVCTDIIRRLLTDYFNMPVQFALGITDIDDKIIAKANSKNLQSWEEVLQMVRKLEFEFFSDMDTLNIARPDVVLRVTEHIPDIIAYILKLQKQGHAYRTADGIYFEVATVARKYDQFGCVPPSSSSSSGLPAESSDLNKCSSIKRDSRDFALWKFADSIEQPQQQQLQEKPPQQQPSNRCEPRWSTPWLQWGRPGWHIECSAMTHSVFGDHLDIHSGGVDLKFPHHTNEIAQCEAHNCSSDDWVKLWLHMGHLHIEGRKMSKSLKNFISVREYFNAQLTNAPADDFRIFCLQHKYHATLTYAPARLEEAAAFRNKVEHFFSYVHAAINIHLAVDTAATADIELQRRPTAEATQLLQQLVGTQNAVHAALLDDFDTPLVLQQLAQLMKAATAYAHLVIHQLGEQKKDGTQGSHTDKDSAFGTADPAATTVVDAATATLDVVSPPPVEPLHSTIAFVSRILNVLGVQFPNRSLQHSIRSSHDSREASLSKESIQFAEVVDSVLDFRAVVRASAIQGIKSSKQDISQGLEASCNSSSSSSNSGSSGSSSSDSSSARSAELAKEHMLRYQRILDQCDKTRDKLSEVFSVQIDDIGGISTWKPK